MRSVITTLLIFMSTGSFAQPTIIHSNKANTWVFIMAGQSNMAGRGVIEPSDTFTLPRVFSISAAGELITAKEPLHFYEPTRTGLDCGMAFAAEMLRHIPDSVNLLIIPAAIGGSSLRQWTGDSLYRGVHLLSNFRDKANWAKQYGTIKGILWHQGESDANEKDLPFFTERLSSLFRSFRSITGDPATPVLIGELGAYSETPELWGRINAALGEYSATDGHSVIIPTGDLDHIGDRVHFNAEGQRKMGVRMALAWARYFNGQQNLR